MWVVTASDWPVLINRARAVIDLIAHSLSSGAEVLDLRGIDLARLSAEPAGEST